MASDRDSLLRAVLVNPGDDLPRLVMADWLEEHGEGERAEFIRLQCRAGEMSRTLFPHTCTADPCPTCGGYKAVQVRVGELLSARARDWFADAVPGASISHWSPHNPVPWYVLPTINGPAFVDVDFVGGFVGTVALDLVQFCGGLVACEACEDAAPDWETNVVECRRCDSTGGDEVEGLAAALFRLHPVRTVQLHDRQPEASEAGEFTWWGRKDDAHIRERRYRLPWQLFDRLTGGVLMGPGERSQGRTPADQWNYTRIYKNDVAALYDLSRAGVAYGRHAAGLPPLPGGAR